MQLKMLQSFSEFQWTENRCKINKSIQGVGKPKSLNPRYPEKRSAGKKEMQLELVFGSGMK